MKYVAATTTAEETTCNSTGEAPKAEFVVESQHGGAAHLLARVSGSIWPHALAPLAAAPLGLQDPCLSEDSAAVNLLVVLQNWCSQLIPCAPFYAVSKQLSLTIVIFPRIENSLFREYG
jgi:hypothetical protein